MSRWVMALCGASLAVAAVEFAVLAGAFAGVDLPDGAQAVYAGVVTNTATGTPSQTATPTITPTPTATPFSPPAPTPNTGIGSISGVITDDQATGIVGATVNVEPMQCCTGPYVSVTTTVGGAYTAPGLGTGQWRVSAYAPGRPRRYYNGTYDPFDVQPVGVTDGANTQGVNIALLAEGHITGIVTNGLGTPVANATVIAQATECCPGSGYATTAADGTYDVGSLAPGEYVVEAHAAGLAPAYFNGTYDVNTATRVQVPAGGTKPGVNFALAAGATITGYVRDASANPIQDAFVYASRGGQCCLDGYAYSAADGSYTIADLAPGSYRIDASATGFVREYYNNTSVYSDATLVALAIGGSAGNIDFSLGTGGSISGVVRNAQSTPIAGALVYAAQDGCCTSQSATTAADGSYQITTLAPGNYRVTASAAGYAGEYYGDTQSYASATLVGVNDNADTPDIDFSLADEAVIRGYVRDGANQPIAGAWVYDAAETCCSSSVQTAADGSYELRGLPAGDAVLEADAAGFVREYYDDAQNFSDATLIPLAPGVTQNDINFQLAAEATISGVVVDEDTSQPIANAWVYVDEDGCCAGDTVLTDSNGAYTADGLPAGSYRVQVSAQGYIDEYYDNAVSYGDATLVVLTTGQHRSGIDVALDEGAHIRGTVRNAGAQPLSGIEVFASATGGSDGGYGFTALDGTYDISGLAAGEYIVEAFGEPYAREYYDNVYAFDDATAIVLADSGEANGIDFSLDLGATITGTVYAEDGTTPLADAFVDASSTAGGSGFAQSDANGVYTITMLPPGTYHASASAPDYATEYYNNRVSAPTADDIVVASGGMASGIDFSLHMLDPDMATDSLGLGYAPKTADHSTAGFGLDAGEAQPCGGIGATVWYSFTAPEPSSPPIGGTLTIDTAGSDFDTAVAVYTGPLPPATPGEMTLVGCDDNGAGQGKVTWAPAYGTTYYIQAGGHNGATGNVHLTLVCTGDADCDVVADITDNCPSSWNYDQKNTDAAELITPGVAPHDTTRPMGDGLGDACDPDIDNDGLPNAEEGGPYPVSPPNPCGAATQLTDEMNPDTDGDGVIDGAECALGSDPNDPNAKPAVGGTDSDGDGLSDAFEGTIGSIANDPDSDDDRILDGIEYKGYGTSLTSTDSDGDGCLDGAEVASIDALNAVNSIDLQLVAKQFLAPVRANSLQAIDINKDGQINSLDLQLVAKNFGPGLCA